MFGAMYTGYRNSKEAHKYFAFGALVCMIMAVYSGHKMIGGKSKAKKALETEETAE